MRKKKHIRLFLMSTAIAYTLPQLSLTVTDGQALASTAVSSSAIAEYLQDFHLTPKPLGFTYKNIPLAEDVTGFNYIGGMLLPLASTADFMGSYITVNPFESTASGWIETPEQTFSIDLKAGIIKVAGQERPLPQGVATLVGEEIYVDASYLSTILPVTFLVNYDISSIEMLPQKPMRVFQRLDFVSHYFAQIHQQLAGTANAVNDNNSTSYVADSSRTDATTQGSGWQGSSSPSTTHTHSSQASGAVSSASSDASSKTSSSDEQIAAASVEKEGGVDGKVIDRKRIVLNTADYQDKQIQGITDPALKEDGLLILQPMIDKIRGDYIEVYQHEHGYYIPLGHLMDMLEVAIGVNPGAVEASGFFIDEARTFYLSGIKNEAIIKGERRDIPPGTVVANPFEVYVDAALLSQLLPMDFELDMADLTLTINPREKLPIQTKIDREKTWAKLALWRDHNQYSKNKKKEYPLIKTPYKGASVPFVDVRAENTYQSNNPDNKIGSKVSVVSAGDLGYVSTESFAQLDTADDRVLTNVRVEAGRQDYEGKLLGPLKAKEAYVGDVQSYPLSLVASSELGRGVKISNHDLRNSSLFDQTDFFGNAQPGWEVELYQNSVLIDFQTVGDDGRYQFKNVPIYYGDNTFRIVVYGPQGQKQEEVRTFNIDDDMAKPGELKYAVSVNEARTTLFDIADTKREATELGNGLAAVASTEYGLTEKLAVALGGAHIPIEDFNGNVGTYDFATAGVKASLFGVLANFDMAYDVGNGGWGTKLTGLYRWNGANIKAEQRFFDEFTSGEFMRSFTRPGVADPFDPSADILDIESKMESHSEVNVSKTFKLPVLSDILTSLNLRRDAFEKGETDTSIAARISKNIFGTNISNDLRSRSISGTEMSDSDVIDGALSVRYRMWDNMLIRAAARYDISPDLEFTSMNLSLQKQLTDNVSARVDYMESLNDIERRRFGAFVNWDFGTFYLSPRFEMDQDAEFIAGVDLLFSLGQDDRTKQWHMTSERIARKGAVSARAFLDENADGVMNDGEQVIKDAVFTGGKTASVNEDGYAFITNMPAFYPYNVQIDPTSVGAEYSAKPKEEAFSVVTHPGVTTPLDYPVVPTVEIEGNAYLEINGEKLEYPGLLIELVNAKGEVERKIRTEFDGYYYLPDIYPGVYTLRVAEKEVKMKHLIVEAHTIDTVALRKTGDSSGYLKGMDFLIRQEGGAVPIAPVEEAPVIELPAGEEVVVESPSEPTAIMPEEQVASIPEEELLPELATPAPQIPLSSSPVKSTAPVVPVISGETPNTKPAPKPDVASKTKVAEIEPLAPLPGASHKPVQPPAPLPPEEGRRVFVQAGLYCDYKNAQKQLETLIVAGFKAEVKGRERNGQVCYTVQVGPQKDLAAAEAMAQELEKVGLENPFIVEENSEVYQ